MQVPAPRYTYSRHTHSVLILDFSCLLKYVFMKVKLLPAQN